MLIFYFLCRKYTINLTYKLYKIAIIYELVIFAGLIKLKKLNHKFISSNIVNESYIKSYFFSFSKLSFETILCNSLPDPIITSYPFIKLFFT